MTEPPERASPSVMASELRGRAAHCDQSNARPTRNGMSCRAERQILNHFRRMAETFTESGSSVTLSTFVNMNTCPERGISMRMERMPAAVGATEAADHTAALNPDCE